MFLLSCPLLTITFLLYSLYFYDFHKTCPVSSVLMLFSPAFSHVFPLLCLPSHFLHFRNIFSLFSCIFPSCCFHFLCLPHISCICAVYFSLCSRIFPCSCSRVLCLPSHFFRFHRIFTISIKHVLFPPFDAIFQHFPMFFLWFPVPTITSPAFSRYFLAIFLHFPKLLLSFPLLATYFLHLHRIFLAMFPHFPMLLLSCPLLTSTFLSFSPYFLGFQ